MDRQPEMDSSELLRCRTLRALPGALVFCTVCDQEVETLDRLDTCGAERCRRTVLLEMDQEPGDEDY